MSKSFEETPRNDEIISNLDTSAFFGKIFHVLFAIDH